jgi:YVTN family beta-propeller protein
VSIFDLAKLTVRHKLSIAGKNPDAIAYDPISKHVFTMNGGSDDATVIDAATETVVASIPLPGRPEFAVSGRDGFVYANIEDKSEIVAIDTKTNGIAHTWPLAPCEEPSGLAIDAEHHRLFSGCHNNLMAVVDAGNGKVVTTLPIGTGVDATAFDPGTQLAFSSNGDGTLTVIHEDSPDAFSVAQNATTRPRARTMALDTITHDVLLVTADVTEGPPAPGLQRPTRTIVPGTFAVLVMTESAR